MSEPTSESSRILALDTLRGFALFGILLLNIIGFGLHSGAYFNPVVDGATHGVNFYTWATVDILFEGSMRALFSILFGAGVVLFTTGEAAKSAGIHYKRNAWLLVLGLFDIMILLWDGDVLFTYALAGMLLYFVRDKSPRWLITASGVFVVLMTLQYTAMDFGLGALRAEAEAPGASTSSDPGTQELVKGWQDFKADFAQTQAQVDAQISARSTTSPTACQYLLKKAPEIFTTQIPAFLLFDALAMMLLGMALYKLGVMSAQRSRTFYMRLMFSAFALGLLVNSFEVYRAVASGFDLLTTFSYTTPTYQLGRLGMAFGYLAIVMLVCQSGTLSWLTNRLAAVGRMALTNYLSHSVICLFIFTGAGLGLVGSLERWSLYLIVFAIWIFQLFFSDWWLLRYRFGPVEWVWRALTYGQWPAMKR